MSDITVRDEPAQQRFEVLVDGQVAGFTRYRREDDVLALVHTEVDDEYEGQGIGSRLVGGAMEQLRRQGVAVLPYCSFVQSYLQRHPDLADLVPAAERARFGLVA